MKIRSLIAAALAGLFIGSMAGGLANARITGTAPTSPDTFCVGRSAAEVCVDRSGNVMPTTTNNQTSGTSSLRWSQTFAVLGSFSGNMIVTPPATETIASAATITANGCGTIKRITNPSAVTTGTTNTFTAPASSNAGCFMFIVNVGTSTITLDNNANFVSAGAADVAMTANDSVAVVSDGSAWYQVSALLAN